MSSKSSLISAEIRARLEKGIARVGRYLEGCEKLVAPDLVNVLSSHNPNVFNRAAEMGIDLTLAGHTHGGQLSLEFIHRGLCLSHLATRYVSGLYQKPGGQLYANRAA